MGNFYKCLSVRQPYAWLIVIGEKRVENKSKSSSHRGKLLVHSSANKQDYLAFQKNNPGVAFAPSWLAFGCIIGAVELADVVEMNAKLEGDPWAYGPNCYLLQKPVWFPQPIACAGNVGLFNLPAQLVAKVEAEFAKPPRRLMGIENVLEAMRPTEVEMLWNRADDAFECGLLPEAKAFLDRLAVKSPRDPDVYWHRAEISCQLLEYGSALADFDHAIALDAKRSDIRLGKGAFLEDMGYLDMALECYHAVALGEQDNAEAIFSRGNIKLNLKDYDAALRDFCRSIELDPKDPEKYSRRGFLHLMLGQGDQANRDFSRASALVREQRSSNADADEE